MTIETAREVAARIWCDPAFSHVVMDGRLCEQIAQKLVEVANEPDNLEREKAKSNVQ